MTNSPGFELISRSTTPCYRTNLWSCRRRFKCSAAIIDIYTLRPGYIISLSARSHRFECLISAFFFIIMSLVPISIFVFSYFRIILYLFIRCVLCRRGRRSRARTRRITLNARGTLSSRTRVQLFPFYLFVFHPPTRSCRSAVLKLLRPRHPQKKRFRVTRNSDVCKTHFFYSNTHHTSNYYI